MIDKNGYHNIDIPSELSYIVNHAIKEGLNPKQHIKHTFLKKCAIATASVLCFIVVLNTSQSFAAVVYKIPLVGQLCRIITFKIQLNVQRNTIKHSSKQAEILKNISHLALLLTMISNASIKNMSLLLFFIMRQNLVLIICSISTILTLKQGKLLRLKIDSIEQEIASWDEERKKLLWDNLEFTNVITENTDFYIAEDGNVVVVFPKYEIAAGSAGSLEFKILPESR